MTEEQQKKSKGKIIKVQREKGFGFIISPEHKFVKFFFHWSSLDSKESFPKLNEGMEVEFIPVLESKNKEGEDRGPRAIQISIIGEPY